MLQVPVLQVQVLLPVRQEQLLPELQVLQEPQVLQAQVLPLLQEQALPELQVR